MVTRGASLALVCCVLSPGAALAYGEPVDGFPNWSERVMWVWVNRARCDPAADLADCGDRCGERACYEPTAPLTWTHELGRAARFQAALLDDIGHGGYIDHDTPCDAVADIATQFTPGPCGGQVACACQGGVAECASGVCERFDARVQRFGGYPTGENIAGSGSPLNAFYMFLYEPWDRTDCARGNDSLGRTNGHRQNILLQGPSIGAGITGGITVQDFGYGESPSGIVAGVHYPESGPSVEMRANWYAQGAPASASVNVDGACHPMTLERGTAENGTYLAPLDVGTSCRHYVFHFVDAAGADVFFPTTGSFAIGCGEDFSASARPPRCGCTPSCGGKTCGDDGCGGTCGSCGADELCTADQCVPIGTDAGPTVPVDGGQAPTPGEDAGLIVIPPAAPPATLLGTCSAFPSRGAPHAAIFLALVALAARLRRR